MEFIPIIVCGCLVGGLGLYAAITSSPRPRKK